MTDERDAAVIFDAVAAQTRGLPPLVRLACAYAPPAIRADTVALFALDARLAGIVRQHREPMLAQLRLAWWRDTLTKPAAQRPTGEPLLGLLGAATGEGCDLVALVDGWEALLGEDGPGGDALADFARGRAQGWVWLARAAGAAVSVGEVRRAGQEWAVADLLGWAVEADRRGLTASSGPDLAWTAIDWPRALRPLAILHGLALRAHRRNAHGRPDGIGAFACAVRLGLFGR